MLPKKLPMTLTCLAAAARIRLAASMLTMFILLASMPVAFTNAGHSAYSPPPTSKPID